MSIQQGTGYKFNSNGKSFTLNVDQPWVDYCDITAPAQPWTPYDNGDDTFSVVPATINSLIPCIGDTGVENFVTYKGEIKPSETYTWSDGDYGTSYIYLQSGVGSGTPPLWPEVDPAEANYPTVYSFDTAQTDDDTYGFILIAIAQREDAESPIIFTQFIFNSLWSERHKYSQPDSALYYYYRL